jgi:predicted dinucleotide-binding enzyme
MAMTIGIIGADDRATTIGRLLQECGHQISFSDPRRPDSAEKAVAAIGGEAKACSTYDQATSSDALVFAIHWEDVDGTLRALGDYKDGIVIDATRPPKQLEEGTSGAEILAKKLDNRHVVKAFIDIVDPHDPILVASDDPEARSTVEHLIEECGRRYEDVGPLANAGKIEREHAMHQPL